MASKFKKYKKKLRKGMSKFVKGKRYILNPKSRWERGYTKKENQSRDLTRDKQRPISAVKTYHGKTKSEIREEYMFSRGRLTKWQRGFGAGALGYSMIAAAKHYRSVNNPYLRLLDVKSISDSQVWKDFHMRVKRGAYKYNKLVRGTAKKVGGKIGTRLIDIAGKRTSTSAKVLRSAGHMARQFRAKPLWKLGQLAIARPQYAVGAAFASVALGLKIAKGVKAQRYKHAIYSREYEFGYR